MEKTYGVVVQGMRGEKLFIHLGNTEQEMRGLTVRQLKEKIAEKLPYTAGDEKLRFLTADKMLDRDTSWLYEYGIQHMSVIRICISIFTGGGGRYYPPSFYR